MGRTGYKSRALVNRYRRVARTVLEAGLPSPAPLHGAIAEFAAALTAANAAADQKKGRPRQYVSTRNRRHYGPVAQSAELRTFNRGQGADDDVAPRDSAPLDDGEVERDAVESPTLPRPAAASRGDGSRAEPTDAELERGILDALAKGLDGVAKALSSRLETRRMVRAGKVIALDARRRGER
jgi:hypothetical protein